MRSIRLLILFVCGCGSKAATPPPPDATSSGAVSSASSTTSIEISPPPPSPGAIDLHPVDEAAQPGPLYLAVKAVGLVEVDGDVSRVVFPTPHGLVGLGMDPAGAVWASFYEEGTIRVFEGKVTRHGKQRFKKFAFRGSNEVYGATDEIEWTVDRFDGKAWKSIKHRKDFKGTYDDNKLEDVAADASGLWVSSWNGLHRFDGTTWTAIEAPASGERLGPSPLFSSSAGMIALYLAGYFVHDGKAWKPLDWSSTFTLDGVNGAGILVGSSREGDSPLRIGALAVKGFNETAGKVSVLDPKFVDGGGRTWVGTDFKLLAYEATGALSRAWEPGAWVGFDGPIEGIVVRGRGPAAVPKAREGARVVVRGKVEIYKSGKPLDGATVELCSDILSCSGSGFARTAATAKDGSFQFTDVPRSHLTIRVAMPTGLDECSGIFRSGGLSSFDPPKDCPKGATTCDVGTVMVCMPFEMPPPRR